MARSRRVLPGLPLSLGYTLFYLSVIVLLPLGALVLRSADLSWKEFWKSTTSENALAAYKITFFASFAAALINSVFGLITAWVLVRYPFPGRRFFDAIVDFPFALPTAVAGLTFSSMFVQLPQMAASWNEFLQYRIVPRLSFASALQVNPTFFELNDVLKITLMLTFVSLPFVIRTVQPVLQDWEKEYEQAAHSLGASDFLTFRRVIFPAIMPAWLSGVALGFARAVGEYGSVVFVAGNIPGKSQIAPLLIMTKLESYQMGQATAIGVVLLGVSLGVLLLLNGLEYWARRHDRAR